MLHIIYLKYGIGDNGIYNYKIACVIMVVSYVQITMWKDEGKL